MCFRLVDNLPVATRVIDVETKETSYELGYKLGRVEGDEVIVHNHLKFLLYYHATADG